jgi:hypothetical protein
MKTASRFLPAAAIFLSVSCTIVHAHGLHMDVDERLHLLAHLLPVLGVGILAVLIVRKTRWGRALAQKTAEFFKRTK